MSIISKLKSIPEPYLSELVLYGEAYGLKTPERTAHFVAQAKHESGGFKTLSENLNYSKDGLMKVFKKYFPDDLTAKSYARQPERIANRVYANRIGNGDEKSGDGWKYRGRGIFQLTGRANYTAFGHYIKEDIENNPDLLLTAEFAVKSALWFWVKNGLNEISDRGITDDVIKAVTLKINGGYTHLSERIRLFKECYAELTENSSSTTIQNQTT